jgi:hypothetical protein
MTVRHIATVWTLTQITRLAWATVRAAPQLGDAVERLELRLEAWAMVRGVDVRDVLAPLIEPLSAA